VKKFLDESLLIQRIPAEEQLFLNVHLPKAILRDWCLCLQLLQEALVEALVFRQGKSSQKIEFRVATSSRSDVNDEEARVVIRLAASDLDFVRHSFLRYYRDEVADVDHIEVDTNKGDYITFSVEEWLPPVSAEEARRRHGLN
jgi:hypothetical protein